jgi:hypothetical protein
MRFSGVCFREQVLPHQGDNHYWNKWRRSVNMRTTTKSGVLGGVLFIASLCIGCGKNETIINSSSDSSTSSGVTAYFPLTNGYATKFAVRTATGDQWVDNFTVGGNAQVQTVTATTRFKYGTAPVDTGYFYATANALYFYANRSATPEKILQLPLAVGQSWQRFPTSGSDTTGGGSDPDTTDGDPQLSADNFPSAGSNLITVRGIETITLSNGYVFSGAVKLATSGSVANSGDENLYWFAPGVGLVKYVLGASGSLSTAEGQVVGELLDYWD